MSEEHRGFAGVLGLNPVMNAVAQWMQLCQIALGTRDELAVCPPEEAARIARRFGVRLDELEEGPGRALLLQKMLVALGIDPNTPALHDPAVMGELRRFCASCRHKTECEHDLAAGTAAKNFSRYCPNAELLDAICVEMTPKLL